jgi:hypothetical protein
MRTVEPRLVPVPKNPVKTLLTITAVIEAGTGVALLVSPSWVVLVLLGSPLEGPASPVIGRVLGGALLSLGLACWLGRDDTQGRAATGLVAAMLLYNITVVVLLCHSRIGSGMAGGAFLPAVILHAALSVWCIAYVRFAHRPSDNGT